MALKQSYKAMMAKDDRELVNVCMDGVQAVFIHVEICHDCVKKTQTQTLTGGQDSYPSVAR